MADPAFKKNLLQKIHLQSHPEHMSWLKAEVDRKNSQLDEIVQHVKRDAFSLFQKFRSPLYNLVKEQTYPREIVKTLLNQHWTVLDDLALMTTRLQSAEDRIDGLKGQHSRQERDLKDSHQADVRGLVENHTSSAERLINKIDDLRKDNERLAHTGISNRKWYGEQIALEKSKNARVIDEIERKHKIAWEETIRSNKSTVSNLRREYKEDIETLKSDHSELVKQMEKTAAAETARLMAEIQYLNGALLKREKFVQITDKQLRQRVEELADQVKSIARVEWNSNTSAWTPKVLGQLSRPPKALKRFIVQDTIWTLLQAYIFESPFRIFGEEGQEQETKWVQTFGEDGTKSLSGESAAMMG